ncbi:hypothetical protein J2Y67_005641 [Neobacillus niacini]|nr:hypothetical protein [Neobacillus niacini]
MERNILREIFFDKHQHWEAFKNKHVAKIRPIVIKEVEKFRDCGDIKKGFKVFMCEGCHDVRKVPYRCKGHFCTTCSVGESEEWGRLLTEDVLQVNHRHVIFTIDEGLRDVFLLHRHLLKDLMDAASKLITDVFQKKAKVTPGIISGLHTFGSRVNFNPHVHMLVTMGGLTEKGEWKQYDFLPFAMLRKQWQIVVLKLNRNGVSEKEKKRIQPRLQKRSPIMGKASMCMPQNREVRLKSNFVILAVIFVDQRLESIGSRHMMDSLLHLNTRTKQMERKNMKP